MTRSGAGFAAILLWGCGEAETCPAPPEPMTAARAREMQPALTQGLAGVTDRDLGPCSEPGMSCAEPTCGRRREAMTVFVVSAGGSLPVDARCSPGLLRGEAEARAEIRLDSNALGEWVIDLPEGLYGLFFAPEGASCARCPEADLRSCWVEVERGTVALRALTW